MVQRWINQEFIFPSVYLRWERKRDKVCVSVSVICAWVNVGVHKKREVPVGEQIISWDRTKSIRRVRQSPQGAGHQRPTNRERERKRKRGDTFLYMYLCVCVFVWGRECKDKREKDSRGNMVLLAVYPVQRLLLCIKPSAHCKNCKSYQVYSSN